MATATLTEQHQQPTTMTLRGASPPPAPAEQNQLASPFLRLPGELRNAIYELLLTPPELTSQQRRAAAVHSSSCSSSLPKADIHPAILRTCKQIHEEATAILYARNTFSAHSTLLTKMPFLIKPSQPILHTGVISQIRNWRVCIRLDTDPFFTAQDVAAAFSGCDSLEVECWQAQFEACDYSVLRLFEEVRGVGKATVTGSVEPGFAHWLELVMESPIETDEERKSGSSTPAYVEMEGEDGRRCARGPGGLPLWVWH
ncbi:hypothetical protein MPH_06299 [Macrophomina phaseolina MS6]|uniref:DUF7730 domain-containing protein n=1 Tax=Macrophomina phaseolina (strain MS6) TaxID=1126212 RepID=K2RP61_MACPH|nr:hypothetical protein MPH_06299 [Macrophomina phaseolina MS6]